MADIKHIQISLLKHIRSMTFISSHFLWYSQVPHLFDIHMVPISLIIIWSSFLWYGPYCCDTHMDHISLISIWFIYISATHTNGHSFPLICMLAVDTHIYNPFSVDIHLVIISSLYSSSPFYAYTNTVSICTFVHTIFFLLTFILTSISPLWSNIHSPFPLTFISPFYSNIHKVPFAVTFISPP